MRREYVIMIAVFVVVTVAAYALSNFWVGYKRAQIAALYSKIENQEKLRDDVLVTDADLQGIRSCKNPKKSIAENCMRDFYDKYTMKNGPEKAFAHLARLQKEHKELLPGCHYISHGIGHATLRLNQSDTAKAFSVMQDGSFFKNVATCGNGYFHGVIEEAAKNLHHNEELAQKIRSICSTATGPTSCYHGAGHALLIQKNYKIPDMLSICERVSQSKSDIFECFTGGFMEYGQFGGQDIVEVTDGKMKLVLCDAQDKKYQPACYMEQSSTFEYFTDEPRNYTRNIGYCKQFDDPLNRMACVKLFAIRSVRISHFADVYSMCNNTSTTQERIMCTAVAASKIARSRDNSFGQEYRSILKTVCSTLNPLYASYCLHLSLNSTQQLFYTSERDLSFSTWRALLLGWTEDYTTPYGRQRSKVCKNPTL